MVIAFLKGYMGKIIAYLTFIYFVQVLVTGSSEVAPSIKVSKQSAHIICLNGDKIDVTPGTILPVIFGTLSKETLVRSPQGVLNCEFGILRTDLPEPTEATLDSQIAVNLDQKALKVIKTTTKTTAKPKMANGKREPASVKGKGNAKIKPKEDTRLELYRIADKMNYAEKCREEFIGPDGFGPWGKYINSELSRSWYSSLMKNNKAFKKVCPGYRFMSRQAKKELWVFILMSMSHYESSCRPKIENQGPYGIAKGLLQLHEGAENRYAHWDQDRICRRGDSKKARESLQCTLSMLNGQVQKHNSIFFEQSYWDVLRNVKDQDTHAAKIKTAIQMLPGCETRSVATENDDAKKGKRQELAMLKRS
jgi:hypothetical protein